MNVLDHPGSMARRRCSVNGDIGYQEPKPGVKKSAVRLRAISCSMVEWNHDAERLTRAAARSGLGLIEFLCGVRGHRTRKTRTIPSNRKGDPMTPMNKLLP